MKNDNIILIFKYKAWVYFYDVTTLDLYLNLRMYSAHTRKKTCIKLFLSLYFSEIQYPRNYLKILKVCVIVHLRELQPLEHRAVSNQ